MKTFRRHAVPILGLLTLLVLAASEIQHHWVPMWLSFSLAVATLAVAIREDRKQKKQAKTAATKDTNRIAFHESAHAVVGHRLGLQVTNIGFDASGNGHTNLHPPHGQPFEDSAWALMVSLIAAHVTDIENGFRDFGSSSDWAHIVELSAALLSTGIRPTGYRGPLTFDDLVRTAGAEAREILSAARTQVHAVASALQETQFLDADEFARLCVVGNGLT